MKNFDAKLEFLKSALQVKETDSVKQWIAAQNAAVTVRVNRIPLNDLQLWEFNPNKGNLVHDSGRFFSIDGIRVTTNWGEVNCWDQPIINQPEVGYLGFIVTLIDGVLHFLVQAKIEPGNVNHVQLSPTIQATRSNYQQTHGGNAPRYLEYFQKADQDTIILDQLQSEQGARFLKKRNRNMIIKVDEDIPLYDNFIWLNLWQIKSLMKSENVVNMDTRTVVSGISYGMFNEKIISVLSLINRTSGIGDEFLISALSSENALHTTEEIITFITRIKSNYDLNLQSISLQEMTDWRISEYAIERLDQKFFSVIGVDVEIGNREVRKWSQPMVAPAQEGLCAFVCKRINGILHFAVQAKLECGNLDIVEFAPTVQTLTGDYKKTPKDALPFLDYVLNCPDEKIYYDCIQSEEGGRFYKEQNRNMIVIAGDELADELPSKFIWMTLSQLYTFINFNNYLNIQARNLIASITFVED